MLTPILSFFVKNRVPIGMEVETQNGTEWYHTLRPLHTYFLSVKLREQIS